MHGLGGVRRMMKVGMANKGASWKSVAAPDAAFSFVPFTIQQNGRAFRPDPSFNIRTRANITVAKTYYVDGVNGLDSNDGSDWAHAIKSILTARNKADVDRLMIKAGWYFWNIVGTDNSPTRSLEWIADGGPVYLTTDVRNEIGAFSASASHYTATVGNARVVAHVWDAKTPDANGEDVRLTLKTSEAEVDAAAGSWYQSGVTIYVHTADGRAPDANLRYYQASDIFKNMRDGLTTYAENIHIRGGVLACSYGSASVAGGSKFYAKDCSFKYNDSIYDIGRFLGTSEVILQNCIYSSGINDGINYTAANGISPNAIEIDCQSYANGNGATDQAATAHNVSVVVRIGGKYHHSAGQNAADVDTSSVWMLGCEMYNSGTGVGYYRGSAGKTWLDSVTIHDNATDLQNEGGSTIYTRSLVSGGNNIIAGTLSAY